ncbi:MAG TPA: ATP-binding cassette domain-containing protein [Candidatus Dormibacteraeota bacterium]|nr:ATP-binding cassette domain-containing protein [Candidatus Dormibacteraeota bacterium]
MPVTSGVVSAPSRLVLEVAALDVRLPTEDGEVHAVRGIDFCVEPGEVLAIAGESGSGKSITSLAILGLLPRTAKRSTIPSCRCGVARLPGKQCDLGLARPMSMPPGARGHR